MKKTGISILASVILGAGVLTAADVPTLRFSGILGQSQPATSEPAGFTGVSGIVFDPQDNLWVSYENVIRQFKKTGGKWVPGDSIKLPYSSQQGGLFWEGDDLVQYCVDNRLYRVNPARKQAEVLASVPDKDVKAVLMAPNGVRMGFAEKNNIFALQGNQVLGISGSNSAVLLTLPTLSGKWHYCALGLEPNTGDLLVGSYYPDCKVYRFTVTGTEVKTEQWPRAGFVTRICSTKNQAWGVMGERFIPLPDKATPDMDKGALGPYPMIGCYGLAEDSTGTSWIGCAQGVLEINLKDASLGPRLGGLVGLNHLVVGDRGTLLGTLEGGSRVLQLNINDEPNTPVLSNANEPYRIGGNWVSRAKGIVWTGNKYVVLDGVGKQLWAYSPDAISQPGTPTWVKLTEPKSFNDPKAVTIVDESLLVMDGNQLKESELISPTAFHTVALPNAPQQVQWMAGHSNGTLILANTQEIQIYRRMQDGSYQLGKGTKGLAIAGIAVAGQSLFVSDNLTGSIVIYDTESGDKLGETNVADQGGMQAGALAISDPWLFVADGKGKRILRFRIQ